MHTSTVVMHYIAEGSICHAILLYSIRKSLGRSPALTALGIVGHTATKGCKSLWKRRGWLKEAPEMPRRPANLRWKSLALEDLGVSGNGRSVRA